SGQQSASSQKVRVLTGGPESHPSSLNLTITASLQNQTLTLQAQFSGAGQDNAHHVRIQWGDGSSETLSLADHQPNFQQSHPYADDPAQPVSRPYVVRLAAWDDEGNSSGLDAGQVAWWTAEADGHDFVSGDAASLQGAVSYVP